jgi:hypothetical protein
MAKALGHSPTDPAKKQEIYDLSYRRTGDNRRRLHIEGTAPPVAAPRPEEAAKAAAITLLDARREGKWLLADPNKVGVLAVGRLAEKEKVHAVEVAELEARRARAVARAKEVAEERTRARERPEERAKALVGRSVHRDSWREVMAKPRDAQLREEWAAWMVRTGRAAKRQLVVALGVVWAPGLETEYQAWRERERREAAEFAEVKPAGDLEAADHERRRTRTRALPPAIAAAALVGEGPLGTEPLARREQVARLKEEAAAVTSKSRPATREGRPATREAPLSGPARGG